VLAHPQLSVIGRITALLPRAFGAARRGDADADALIAELDRLAHSTTEPQRLLPVALLRAEAAWTASRTKDILAVTDEV
jgi:hypothetical protein